MIEKAKEFSQSDLFHSESTFSFFKSWNDIPNEMLIEFAASHSLITQDQKSAALAQNGLLKVKMEKIFEQQVLEFKDDLEIWLKGGKQNCLEIPPVPPTSAPPMGLAQPQ